MSETIFVFLRNRFIMYSCLCLPNIACFLFKLSFSDFMPMSYSAPASTSQLQIPARYQGVLQAALNYSPHQPSFLSSSSLHSDPDSVVLSASLLPSPSQSSLSSLASVTLLPPPDTQSLHNKSGPAPVPVVLPISLTNLPPTPSGAPPPQFIPSLPLPPVHPMVPKLVTPLPLPVKVKSQLPTSTLPGIHALPEHPVKHL